MGCYLPKAKFNLHGRCWGHQNNYHAKLCSIAAALWATPDNVPLVIHPDALAAKKAIKKRLSGAVMPPDTPSHRLLTNITNIIHACPATVRLQWVKAHCGVEGNKHANSLAKQALTFPPLQTPTSQIGRHLHQHTASRETILIDADNNDAFWQTCSQSQLNKDIGHSCGKWYAILLGDRQFRLAVNRPTGAL